MKQTPAKPHHSLQDRTLPKYSIAVASDLSGIPPQQLRRMEESGLITPRRTDGNTRRYSDNDMARITAIAELSDAGINPSGIRHILTLRQEIDALRADLAALREEVAKLRNTSTDSPSTTDNPTVS
jgi:MerR family transcriptional regulator/heat shock protein HspR